MDTTECTGVVIGHTIKIYAEQRIKIPQSREERNDPNARIGVNLFEAEVNTQVQLWVDGRIVLAPCPRDIARVVLHGNRRPTLEEAQEILRITSGTYPLGTELTLLARKIRRDNGRPFLTYTIKRGQARINIDPVVRRRQQQQTPEPPQPMLVEPAAEVPVETPAS